MGRDNRVAGYENRNEGWGIGKSVNMIGNPLDGVSK